MTAVRILICDDEPPAINRLASLLSRIDGVTVVAKASSGIEALSAFERHRPALMILDIEMPGYNGFDVVDAIAAMRLPDPPLIVFATAYDHLAIEAFECGAVDFLPKPVRQSRLEKTIARVRTTLEGRTASARLAAIERGIAGTGRSGPSEPEHVWVTARGELVRIELDSLERISAEGPYVRLYVHGASYLHREPLSHLALKMSPHRFVRIHRSHLVKLDRVSAVRRKIRGGCEVVLVTSEVIPVGKKYSRDVRSRLTDSRRLPAPRKAISDQTLGDHL